METRTNQLKEAYEESGWTDTAAFNVWAELTFWKEELEEILRPIEVLHGEESSESKGGVHRY